MLFFSYFIYLTLWIVYSFVLLPLFQLNIPVFLSCIIIYFISLIFSLFLLFLIRSYEPHWLKYVYYALKIEGVRWLSFVGLLISTFLIILQLISGHINWITISFAMPYLVVSLLNWLGIEYRYAYLVDVLEMPEDIVSLPEIPETVRPELTSDKFNKHFRWEFKGMQFSVDISVRESVYKELKAKPRVGGDQWAEEYVANGIYPEIRELAFKLYKIGQEYYSYGSREEVEFILGFVQSAIRYERDMIDGELTEYPKYPIETIVEEAGDCEDVSFLGAALLKSMGYDVALLDYPGHIALGISGSDDYSEGFIEYNNKKYLYVEMTARGWEIGEIPDEYLNANVKVYPIPDLILK